MFCQIILGPAGSGKSTYCAALQRHCQLRQRTVHVFNCDPAAEDLSYEPSIDIRDLIALDDVKEDLGPNGGLVYCIEHLTRNLDWLVRQLGDFNEDYLLIDMPGQVELYSHYKHINAIIRCMSGLGYVCSAVYLIDSRFLLDSATYMSAVLMAMAVQMNLELPHFNALTKMDLVKRDNLIRRRDLDSYLDPDSDFLMSKLARDTAPKFRQLNAAIAELVADYSLVQFHPISVQDPDSLDSFLLQIDTATQYEEDREPQMAEDPEMDDYVDLNDKL